MTSLLAISPGGERLAALILAVVLAASASLWGWIFTRWKQSKPIIPLARRRPVPWHGQDVLFIFLLAFFLPGAVMLAVRSWTAPEPANEAAERKPETTHPAEQLLRTGNIGMIAVAALMAVVVAPVIEEFLFRVLLQGWLEAVWSRRRRRRPRMRQPPISWAPIVLPALLFAVSHLRFSREQPSSEYWAISFLAQIGGDFMVILTAIALLRFGLRATAADLGWQPKHSGSDIKLGILALVAAIPPVLAIQVVLVGLFQSAKIGVAPDPLPLFFLALVLGWLYHRTHRIAPSLVLHMAFNATSVALIFIGK
jgi:membrane protease YdiL (CAAX protease family)